MQVGKLCWTMPGDRWEMARQGNALHYFGNVVLRGVVIHTLLSFMIQSLKQMQGLGKEAQSPLNEEEQKAWLPLSSPTFQPSQNGNGQL